MNVWPFYSASEALSQIYLTEESIFKQYNTVYVFIGFIYCYAKLLRIFIRLLLIPEAQYNIFKNLLA